MKKTYKRIVSLVLVFVMMFAFSANAVAAEVNTVKSVDEILDEYREKCRELEMNNGAARTASVGATRAELRAETVSELNAAGYEAYELTPSNREAVESALATDFDEMGLNPNGSYVVVASGENMNSRAAGNSFSYTYGGQTYTLRYLTVMPGDDEAGSGYTQISDGSCIDTSVRDTVVAFFNAGLMLIDEVAETDLGTIADICGVVISNIGFSDESNVTLFGKTEWTRYYTQVFDSYDQAWAYGSCTDRADCEAYFAGWYFDRAEGVAIDVDRTTVYETLYSANCYNSTWRNQQAVIAYLNGNTYAFDSLGDIDFNCGNDTVFTHRNNF